MKYTHYHLVLINTMQGKELVRRLALFIPFVNFCFHSDSRHSSIEYHKTNRFCFSQFSPSNAPCVGVKPT